MLIFLDSANLDEIRQATLDGIIDGITTNPSLMAKSKENITDLISQICAYVPGDVSVEVVSTDYDSMLIEAELLSKIADNIVIKLPVTLDGIKLCRELSRKGVKTNLTLCFTTNQALLAAKAGATYISPFIGRLDDIGDNGLTLIKDIRQIYDNYAFKTKILAASVRTMLHVKQSAIIGADAVTMNLKLLKQLCGHPLTDQGLEIFSNDWTNSGHKL